MTMNFLFSIFLSVFVFTDLLRFASACNGFTLKLHYLKSCGENNIINIKDAGSTMDKQCFISPAGCVNAKAFKTASIHYRAEKKPLPPIEGDIDLCKALAEENEYAMLATGALGLPQSCPVEDQEICASPERKVNISKYKNKLGMALGVAEVNITITHDTGTTCLTMKTEFQKPRKMG